MFAQVDRLAEQPPAFGPVGDSETSRPGFVLTMGDYFGTLGAARCLGRRGVAVTLVDAAPLARTRWSRWTRSFVQSPPVEEADAFVAALLEVGERSPGHVLYPSSDDTAFLFALRANALRRVFRTYQPSVDVVYALLNKKLLFRLCDELSIPCPETWFPESSAELDGLARSLGGPVLLKPQTQIQFASKVKGALVRDPRDLPSAYARFEAEVRYGSEVSSWDPDVSRPIVQRFLPEASERIYSLAGFVDEQGNHAARAAIKVLQRPRKFGVGVCFESAAVRSELLEAVLRLCRRAGYFGAFEVEFIDASAGPVLIDFNPRFYGEMAFEMARGLPLDDLVYTAACDRPAALRKTLQRAGLHDDPGAPTAYRHGVMMELLLAVERASGKMSALDVQRWRDWRSAHSGRVLDAVLVGDDWRPAALDLAREAIGAVRHPRAFFRSLF